MFCASKNWRPQPSFSFLPRGLYFPHVWELSHQNLYDSLTQLRRTYGVSLLSHDFSCWPSCWVASRCWKSTKR